MKTLIRIIDNAAFFLFGAVSAYFITGIVLLSSCLGKRRCTGGRIKKLSFAVFDLISNKYDSMFEDALLNGYIASHSYVYLDFNHKADRFEEIGDKIRFYSIAAHPGTALYNAGFKKVSMLLTEARALAIALWITYRDGINLVKAHDPHLLGLNGLIVARSFRLPCVLHMNSDFDMKYRGTGKISSPMLVSRGVERMFESTIMRFYDLIMADRKFYGNSRNFPRHSLNKYRPFGVRVDRLHYTDPGSRRDLRGPLGLAGKKVLLYVGRLHPVKYPEDAMKAFAIIRKDVPDAVLLVVGTGILKGDLERMAYECGIGESVRFLGQKSYEQLIDILYTADVLLAPHGGMTLVESALASTPVVAYDFDWHSEFLKDGEMGYIVPFRDYEGMARQAVRILKDQGMRTDMRRRCRQAAVSGCSREASMRNERKVYEELVGI